MTGLSIHVPTLPPSPNRTRRGHWAEGAGLTAAWRRDGRLLALAELNGAPAPRWTRVRLSAVFYLPTRARRDPGNLVGSEGLKALIDGLVDAEVMVDDSLAVVAEYGPFTFELRPRRPGVTVTVESLG